MATAWRRLPTQKALEGTETPSPDSDSAETEQTTVELTGARRCWAELLRRVYEIDPLVCPKCGGQMRVIGFITEPQVIRRILDHLKKKTQAKRGPPASTTAPALASV